MFCTNCGKPLPDGVRFCTSCGAPVEAEPSQPPAAAPAAPHYAAPVQKKPRRTLLTVAAIVVLLALCVFGVSRLLLTPKNQLGLALKKSISAYNDAAEKVLPFDASKLAKERKFSQELALSVVRVPDADELRDFGVRMRVDADLKSRYVGAEMALTNDTDSLITARLALDGDEIYAACPELLDSRYYGVNTKTFGVDLLRSDFGSEVDEEFGSMSFNLFDLAETYLQPKELDKSVTDAFLDAIEVEKDGTERIDVNGASTSCTRYRVSIPRRALQKYTEAWIGSYTDVYGAENMMAMFEAMGLPEYALSEMNDSLEYELGNTEDEMLDSLDELFDAIGDLDLDVYVSGGRVAGFDCETEIEYSDVTLSGRFGGGKSYVDALSLSLDIDGTQMLLESTGNHALRDGTYTDETCLTVDGEDVFVSSCSYKPSASGSNFSYDLKMTADYDTVRLTADGRVEADKHTLNVTLDELSFKYGGEAVGTFGVNYVLSSFEKSFHAKDVTMLLSMTEDDLNALGEEITANAERWAERYSDLFYAFY